MTLNQRYTVKIEKMLNEGGSLARYNGLPIFINGGCPGDEVLIEIVKVNKKYLTGTIIDILKPSKNRVEPFCPMCSVCGSCDWQHISYDEQLKQKQNIVRETFKNITGKDLPVNDVVPSPLTKEYRCKVQLPVSQTKVSKRFLTGYFKKNSHELINIKYCPLQPSIINEINEFVKINLQNLNISAYDEISHLGLIRHIIYRISSDCENILITFVVNSEVVDKKLKELAKILKSTYPQVVGICANFNTRKTNVIMGENTLKIVGDDFYIESLSDKKYKISANSFFQVNPLCAELIFDNVKEIITQKCTHPIVLDAYSGVSSFGIWLSDISEKIVSIEEVQSASEDAVYNKKLNSANNIEIINGDAAKEFEKLIQNNIKFDVSLIDPPRKGCSEEALKYLLMLSKKYILYVSCNPATLARDMNYLSDNSFEPVYIQPVDMFPHTYHIETIVLFEKQA